LVFKLSIGIIASLNFWELKSLVREALINHECFSLFREYREWKWHSSQIVERGGWF